MSFVVTANRGTREVSFQRSSMLAALEQALALASSGLEDVLIRDSNGCTRTPTEFSRALRDGRTASETAARVARAA